MMTTPELMQSSMAVISVTIAWFIYKQGEQIDRQGAKIQDLANIVTELKKQNETLDKRLLLEKRLALRSIVPVYRWDHNNENEENKKIMHLVNVGAEAKSIYTDEKPDDTFNVFLANRVAGVNQPVKLTVSSKDGGVLGNVEFNICSTAINGETCKQRIFQNRYHELQIDIPVADI